MAINLNHIKKGESISDKQLILINSNERDNLEQSSSSFTYTFDQPVDRISKMEVMCAKIPKTFYNVNNDNATMSITTETLSETYTTKLVVDDNEIKTGNILATNVLDGTVLKTNLIKSNGDVKLYKIITQGSLLYISGQFRNNLINFTNFNGETSSQALPTVGECDVFVAKYSIEQELIKRWRIGGSLDDCELYIYATNEFVFAAGQFKSLPLSFYDSTDTSQHSIISDGNLAGFVTKYNINGEFQWAVKILGVNRDISPILITVDDTNKSVYVTGSYKNSLSFYNKLDSKLTSDIINIPYTGSGDTYVFIAKYNFDGELLWVTSATGGCRVNAITFNLITTRPIIGLEFFKPLVFSREYDNGDIASIFIGTPLELIGVQNLAVIEITSDGNIYDRMRIGGSNMESGIKLDVVNNMLVVTCLYNSNPLGVYNYCDVNIDYIAINGLNKNIFFAKYELTSTTKTFLWGSNIYSGSDVGESLDISVSDNGDLLIAGSYTNLLKFNDVDGHVISKDLYNTSESNVYTFIAKYSTSGKFQTRSYITSSTDNIIVTSVDAHSSNTFISGHFNSPIINLYNSNNSFNTLLNNTPPINSAYTYNGVLVSYISNINNFSIDSTTLRKRIICKSLVGTDINYVINANAFSQQLGFNDSTLMRAMLFGAPISWDAINISAANNLLSLEFSIGDKTTKTFTRQYYNINITRSGSYRPYNLAFELNKIIRANVTMLAGLSLNPTDEFIKYDAVARIFYLIFTIDGTFKLTTVAQPLSGPAGMNLSLMISPHCAIADANLADEPPISINDNSKLSIKLSNDNTETRFNNVEFSEAFPNINGSSGVLTVNAKQNNKVTLVSGDVKDDIATDIYTKDSISFDAPWQYADKNEDFFTDKLQWQSISSNSDSTYITAVVNDGHIYVSNSGGDSWVKKEFSRQWRSISVSHTGQYQSAVSENGQIYISRTYGENWTPKESVRQWVDIVISRSNDAYDGKHQTAVVKNGNIFVSHDRGETWVAKGPTNHWTSVTLDASGVYQIAVALAGSIWRSVDSGYTWSEILNTLGSWRSVDMTNDGTLIAAVGIFDKVYYSTDNGATWDGGNIVSDGKSLGDISLAKIDSQHRAISCVGGSIYNMTNGSTWATNRSQENWSGVAISDDGTKRIAIVKNGSMYRSTNSGTFWTELKNREPWLSVAMSSDGVYQMITSGGGVITLSPVGIPTAWQSSNGGNTWSKIYDPYVVPIHTYRQTGLAMSADGKYRYCTSGSIGVMRSSDYGATWGEVGVGGIVGTGVSVSTDGKHVTIVSLRYIYVSNDFGESFIDKPNLPLDGHTATDGPYHAVCMNADGSIQIAYGFNGAEIPTLYISYDYWDTHTEPIPRNMFQLDTAAAISSDGTVAVIRIASDIYISRDSTATFTTLNNFLNTNVKMFAISYDGNVITAAISDNPIFISRDKGMTFNNFDIARLYQGVAMSSTGELQAIVVNGGDVYESNDYGATWNVRNRIFGDINKPLKWTALAISRNGKYIVSCAEFDKMYLSKNYGKTFNIIAGASQQWTSAAISDDGSKIVGLYSFSGGWISGVQTSWDGGATFYTTPPTGYMSSIFTAKEIAMSGDGYYVALVGFQYFGPTTHYIYISNGSAPPIGTYDVSWQLDITRVIPVTPTILFGDSIAMSASGLIKYMSAYGKLLKYVSSSGTPPPAPVYNQWYETGLAGAITKVTCDDSGSKVMIVINIRIRISTNYGVTFSGNLGPVVSITSPLNLYARIKISGDGLTQATISQKTLYVSYNDWATYTTTGISMTRSTLGISANGYQMATTEYDGWVYQSFDRGDTFGVQQVSMLPTQISIGGYFDAWTFIISSTRELYATNPTNNYAITSSGLSLDWSCIASARQMANPITVAGTSYGKLYISDYLVDGSIQWVNCGPLDVSTPRRWNSCAVSGDGVYKLASNYTDGVLYMSNNLNINTVWVDSGAGSRNWLACAISQTGQIMTACEFGGYIYVSNDYGATWISSTDQRNWNSIAMVADGSVMVASVFKGLLYRSTNGINWTSLTTEPRDWQKVAVSLAPVLTPDGYYYSAVALNDYIYTTDRSLIFEPYASATNWASIIMSASGETQYAVDYGQNIYVSIDYGKTWNIMKNSKELSTITMNSTGQIIAAAEYYGNLYLSNNFGITWNKYNIERSWNIIKMSNSGNNIVAAVNGDSIYVSNDSGITWSIDDPYGFAALPTFQALDINTDGSVILFSLSSNAGGRKVGGVWTTFSLANAWIAVAVSDVGDIQYAATAEIQGTPLQIQKSTDYGATWNFIPTSPSKPWSAINISANGSIISAVTRNDRIYVSTNSGSTWEARASVQNWKSIALSADGVKQIAAAVGGLLYVSTDTGVTWTSKESPQQWQDVAISSDGNFQAVCNTDRVLLHDFELNQRITFNIDTIETNNSVGRKAYTINTTDTNYFKMHNFDLSQGFNYTIIRSTPSDATDIFIPAGNYTPASLIDTINDLILELDTTWITPYGFKYDGVSGKISFTPKTSGSNILSPTNLLTQMGFTDIPSAFTSGIKVISTNLINPDISGPLNIFIKSNTISEMRKHRTAFSRNKNLKNIIAPLVLDANTNSYQVPYPVEIFLSEKSRINLIDVSIVDESGSVVNLNGGPVQVNFYFYSS